MCRLVTFVMLFIIAFGYFAPNCCHAQANVTSPAIDKGNDVALQISDIQLGLNGVWKVGFPTRFSFSVSVPSNTDVSGDLLGTVLINTVDGEGIDVSYEFPFNLDPSRELKHDEAKPSGNRSFRFEAFVVHGRPNRSIHFTIRKPKSQENGKSENYQLSLSRKEADSNSTSDVTDKITLGELERGKILPASQPWIVGIGTELELNQVAQQSAQGRLPSYVSTEVEDVSMLPAHSQSYRGVDLLVLPTYPSTIIEGMTTSQQSAIQNWVRQGGYLQVWGGANASKFNDWAWLSQMLPVESFGVAPDSEPGTIESYLSSQKRLDRLTLGKFKLKDGVVDLIDRTKLPLIIRGAYGFGQVQVFSGDLNTKPLANWTDRRLLLEKLLVDAIEAPRKIQVGSSAQVAFLGYDDLAGQVKSWLDVFPSVQNGNLLAMAAVLAALIALIGPFDYFVIQRSFQKPIWTWWSLSTWSILAIGLLIAISSWWKPDRQMLNSIEILDVDYATRTARGSAYLSQYVGKAGSFDVSATARRLFLNTSDTKTNEMPVTKGSRSSDISSHLIQVSNDNRVVEAENKVTSLSVSESTSLQSETNSSIDSSSSEEKKKSPIYLTWSGQPGAGLGGFDSNVRTDFGYPSYSILEKGIRQLGIPTAGTKSLMAEWDRSALPKWSESHFEILQGSDFLEGVWVNPLQEELLEPILIYRGWIYRLPSKIRPGGEVRIAPSDIPKDLGRYLQRRTAAKENEFAQAWDPSGGENVNRLVDILTMYRAAGGSGYTGLSHRYLGKLDLTALANLNRAVIYGRLPEPIVDITVKQSDEKLVVRNSNRAAFVRFVLPVLTKQP